MFKRLLIAAVGAVALSAAAVPQVASAQSLGRGGFGQMGGGSDEFRMRGGHGSLGGGQGQFGGGHGGFGGGQGQFGGGRGQFGGGEGARFHNDYRPFGGSGMARRGSEDFRFRGERGRFGGDQGFRFGQNQRSFGYGEGIRVRHVQEHFGYGDRFRGGREFEYRRGFEHRNFRHGYGVGVVRAYPTYRTHFREGGFGIGYVRPYAVRVGYAFPGAGCTTRRSVSFTPFGWRKIVTVRTCYVR